MFLPEDQVRPLLTYEALVPAIRQALIDYSAGKVDQPPRMILRSNHIDGPKNGWFAVMPVVYDDVMGVKTVTFFPGNAEFDPKFGLHTHMAIVQLLSRETGEPLALMDGRLITEMRTAAASAVALNALARPGVVSLGILGAGVQARSHLAAFRMIRPGLTDLRIWSRNPENAARLAQEASARAVPIEEAAAADVVLTATASPCSILRGRWLRPDALVIAVGAVGPQLRELDDEAARTSYVVAESRLAVEREAGDIVLSGAPVQAEIGEILALLQDNPAGFSLPSGRILYKSVGMAVEDVVAARLVWRARVS